jgi:hypothetical protein
MTDWTPVIAGFVIIAIAIGIVRFAPRSAAAQELRRSYGIRPTGERGERTRRDHVRSAGLAVVAAIVLYLTSSAAGSFLEHGTPGETRSGAIAFSYTFVALLLALMATASAIRSFWKAGVWRMELPDTPEHRHRLADAIDHLLDGGLSPDERRDYLDVVYLQPQLEQVRRATLRLSRQNSAGMPEDFRLQIKQWTAGIRASAGPRELSRE